MNKKEGQLLGKIILERNEARDRLVLLLKELTRLEQDCPQLRQILQNDISRTTKNSH